MSAICASVSGSAVEQNAHSAEARADERFDVEGASVVDDVADQVALHVVGDDGRAQQIGAAGAGGVGAVAERARCGDLRLAARGFGIFGRGGPPLCVERCGTVLRSGGNGCGGGLLLVLWTVNGGRSGDGRRQRSCRE